MTFISEAQAKDRWCPHARIVRREEIVDGNEHFEIVGGVNRDALGGRGGPAFPHSCRCIASACMAWRWQAYRETKINAGEGDELRGYCGAFGIPMESIV